MSRRGFAGHEENDALKRIDRGKGERTPRTPRSKPGPLPNLGLPGLPSALIKRTDVEQPEE